MGDELAMRLLRAGARGLLPPSAGSADVAEAIRVVSRGGRYLTPELQRLCAERYLVDIDDQSPGDSLSPREFQILRLLALGHTNREIAVRLHISVKTVETYQAHIKEKLALRNARELVQHAVEWSVNAKGA